MHTCTHPSTCPHNPICSYAIIFIINESMNQVRAEMAALEEKQRAYKQERKQSQVRTYLPTHLSCVVLSCLSVLVRSVYVEYIYNNTLHTHNHPPTLGL